MTDALKVDAGLIRELAKLLEETGLSEIEISEGAQHVRIARKPVPASPSAVPAPEMAPVAAEEESSGGGDISHPGDIVSPMVGTLYLAPDPGSPPFVVPGDQVSEGDTLFIIEAMKTMNPVRAPLAGTVKRVLASNETPVEFGEVLAIIE